VLIGSYILVCRTPGQIIPAPLGLSGTLKCPASFSNYCKSKSTCPYHCNKNGACINGKCLCTGSTSFSSSCLDVSILTAPVGSTGGLLRSIASAKEGASDQIISYSLNKKCFTGSVFDSVFG
jgi:hypothetical protein